MPTIWINLRLFFESARLSYVALFRWLNPPTYLASKIIMPLSQLLFFTLLGVYATGAKNSSFYVIGNAIHVVSVTGIYGVSMTIGEDRFHGTLPYLFAVPVNRLYIFLGRALFPILDGVVGVIFSLLIGTWLFGLDLSQANLPALLATLLVTAAATCGFGLLLGSISLITVNALFVGNTFYFLLLALTGANIPVETLPVWLQSVAAILPITRGLAATRAIIAGASLAEVMPLLLGELTVGVAYAAIGYLLFRVIEVQARRLGTLESV